MKPSYAYFNKKIGHFKVELVYSWWHCLSGNLPWFCRIWLGCDIISEEYGHTKFSSYRLAYSKVPYWIFDIQDNNTKIEFLNKTK